MKKSWLYRWFGLGAIPRKLFATVSEPGILKISFESSDFRDNWRGMLVYIYKTDKARAFYEALMAAGVRSGLAGE